MNSMLFLDVGVFAMRTGRRQIAEMAGFGRVMPFSTGCYALATFALMGLSRFNGFISKFLMIDAAAAAGHVEVGALILLGSVIGTFHCQRVARLLFFHPNDGSVVSEAPASMLIAMGVLTAAAILGGVLPNFQLGLVRPAADRVAARNGLAPAVIPNLVIAWPAAAAIGTVGAMAVWLVGRQSVAWAGRRRRPRRRSPSTARWTRSPITSTLTATR